MKPDTLKALRASIAHWRRLATGKRRENESIGWRNCALCKRFLDLDCVGCPVREATGQPLCQRTPYVAADYALGASDAGFDSAAFKAAALKELKFLESLLPK